MEADFSKTRPKKHPKMSHFGTQEATKRCQKVTPKTEKKSTRKTIEKNMFFQKPSKTLGFECFWGVRAPKKGQKWSKKKSEKVMQKESEKERKRTERVRKLSKIGSESQTKIYEK